jgi:succinate dehydrogenase/fumarate reductase flavoprotein subunit
MAPEKVIETDVLVIGGGMAGIFAAIKARELGCDVTLVDKGYAGRSGATHFAGGDYLVFNPEWGHNLDAWMVQINTRCEYFNHRQWSEIVLKDSYERYKDLLAWGIKLYQKGGKIWVERTGALECFNLSYREYAPLLRKKAEESGVRVLDKIVAGELLKQDGKVVGVVGFHTTSGSLYIFKTKATVIATGGGSLKEGNRPIYYWTADGEAMAYRAGAEISGKEFKFGTEGIARSATRAQKPTTKGVVPEEVSDSWARFPAFRAGVMGPMVAPTINAEGGPVLTPSWEAHLGRAPLYVDLDAFTPAQVESFHSHFQRLETAEPDKVGLDIFRGGKLRFSVGSIEVAQPIHGGGAGIWPVNTKCATGLPGLYAAGDSCATMASAAAYAGMGFGLCHASVTGTRAGLAAAEYALKAEKIMIDEKELGRLKKIVLAPMERSGGFSPGWVTQVLQGIMLPYFILLVKHGERLQAALTLVEFMNKHLVPKLKANDAHEWRMAQETKNMALHAEMILRASIYRTESRGTHFREDYPRRDDPTWLVWVKFREEQGNMKISREPIPGDWWPDLAKPYEERYPRMFPGEE